MIEGFLRHAVHILMCVDDVMDVDDVLGIGDELLLAVQKMRCYLILLSFWFVWSSPFLDLRYGYSISVLRTHVRGIAPAQHALFHCASEGLIFAGGRNLTARNPIPPSLLHLLLGTVGGRKMD